MNLFLSSFSASYAAPVPYLESLVPLVQRHPSAHYKHYTRTPIHIARQRAADEALKQNATHLVMIDDDQTFASDTLERLLSHDVPVISALAYQRLPPFNHCTFIWTPGDTVLHFDYKTLNPRGGLTQVDATGFPFVVIKIEVFKQLGTDCFGYWRSKDGSQQSGEDIFFCARCRDHNIPVYCDTSLVVGHLGPPPVITEADYRRHKEEQIASALRHLPTQ